MVYALDPTNGALIWWRELGAGVWVSPACDGEKLCVGDRAGTFHALSTQDDTVLWSLLYGGMILTPASIAPGGERIVFASRSFISSPL